MNNVTHKTCPDCGESDISKFSRHNKSRDGLQKLCKTCFREAYWSPRSLRYYGISCSVQFCDTQAVVKGLCRKHYNHLHRYDHIDRKPVKSALFNEPSDNIPWKPLKGSALNSFEHEYGR